MATRIWFWLPDDSSGTWVDLADLMIPYPRAAFLTPRAIRATMEGYRIADGWSILELQWDFARQEWLIELFGVNWVRGIVLYVDRSVRIEDAPIERGGPAIVTGQWRIRFRRPDLHEEGDWDMGVWRELNIQGIILRRISA